MATGVEGMVARDTSRVVYAKDAGEVVECDAAHIVVKIKKVRNKNIPQRLSNELTTFQPSIIDRQLLWAIK